MRVISGNLNFIIRKLDDSDDREQQNCYMIIVMPTKSSASTPTYHPAYILPQMTKSDNQITQAMSYLGIFCPITPFPSLSVWLALAMQEKVCFFPSKS